MKRRFSVPFVILVLALVLPLLVSAEEEWQYEIGPQMSILAGDGVPANDMTGIGVMGRYKLKNGWFVGAAIDSFKYDFENPPKILGLDRDPSAKVIDADGDYTEISASLGRLYGETNHGFDWFWSLGVGFASTNVDDVAGTIGPGSPADFTFDVSDEIHVKGALGTSYNFSEKWSAGFVARLEHHFMDILITERVSGITEQIDSQTPIGVSFDFKYRF